MSTVENRQQRNPGEQEMGLQHDAEGQQGDCKHHNKHCTALQLINRNDLRLQEL